MAFASAQVRFGQVDPGGRAVWRSRRAVGYAAVAVYRLPVNEFRVASALMLVGVCARAGS